jgi:hypothetical protein
MNATIHVDQAIASIRALAWKATSLASEDFDHYIQYGGAPEHDNKEGIKEAVETAFLQLLTLAESLGQGSLSRVILETYENAKRIGLSKQTYFENESAWSYWQSPLERFADSIAAVFGSPKHKAEAVSSYLLSVLRNTQGAITDKRCFSPPANESEVHDRIEVILKFVYPDLVRKPTLPKPVVHFIPDSGIPSISTLIEYKYMSQVSQAGTIANEILADTRGYVQNDWDFIVFVIYETRRFKTLAEWQQLLASCGLTTNVQLIVLHGEEPIPKPPSAVVDTASTHSKAERKLKKGMGDELDK